MNIDKELEYRAVLKPRLEQMLKEFQLQKGNVEHLVEDYLSSQIPMGMLFNGPVKEVAENLLQLPMFYPPAIWTSPEEALKELKIMTFPEFVEKLANLKETR